MLTRHDDHGGVTVDAELGDPRAQVDDSRWRPRLALRVDTGNDLRLPVEHDRDGDADAVGHEGHLQRSDRVASTLEHVARLHLVDRLADEAAVGRPISSIDVGAVSSSLTGVGHTKPSAVSEAGRKLAG